MAKWFLKNNRLSVANGISASMGGIGSVLGPILTPVIYDEY